MNTTQTQIPESLLKLIKRIDFYLIEEGFNSRIIELYDIILNRYANYSSKETYEIEAFRDILTYLHQTCNVPFDFFIKINSDIFLEYSGRNKWDIINMLCCLQDLYEALPLLNIKHKDVIFDALVNCHIINNNTDSFKQLINILYCNINAQKNIDEYINVVNILHWFNSYLTRPNPAFLLDLLYSFSSKYFGDKNVSSKLDFAIKSIEINASKFLYSDCNFSLLPNNGRDIVNYLLKYKACFTSLVSNIQESLKKSLTYLVSLICPDLVSYGFSEKSLKNLLNCIDESYINFLQYTSYDETVLTIWYTLILSLYIFISTDEIKYINYQFLKAFEKDDKICNTISEIFNKAIISENCFGEILLESVEKIITEKKLEDSNIIIKILDNSLRN